MIRENAAEFAALIEPKFVVTGAYKRVYLPDQRPTLPTDPTVRRTFFPFVVIWPSRRFAADVRRLSDDSSIMAFRAVTMCVGSTASQVFYAEEKVTEAVEGARLNIAGFSSTPIHHESSGPVLEDPDVEELFTSSIDWTWVCTRSQAA